jgi:hypothetical protein
LKENIFAMSLISFIHYMTSSTIYCSIPNELIQFEVLPYIDKTLYGKLVMVNTDFYYCCFNGAINFIVKVKPELKELLKWGKTKIMLELDLSHNETITDNDLKNVPGLKILHLYHNSKITDNGGLHIKQHRCFIFIQE